MTGLERIRMTLRGECADRVPMFDYLYQKKLFEDTIGVHLENYDLSSVIDCAKVLHHDMVAGVTGTDEKFESVINDNGEYIDEFGTVMLKSDVSWPVDAPVSFPIHDRDDYKKYKWPDPTAKGRVENLQAGIAKNKDELAVLAGVEGPFIRAWLLLGPEELLIQMHTDPEFIKTLVRDSTDYLIAVAKNVLGAGPHIFALADDLGYNSGPFMSLPMFHEFFLHEYARLMGTVKIPVFFHSCGHVTPFIPDLIDLGVAAIHPIQRTAQMDLKSIKERFGRRITLVGNVDSTTTLPYGSSEDVEKEVLECLEIGKPGGRYILASDHSLHDGISVENIRQLFNTGLKYGRY